MANPAFRTGTFPAVAAGTDVMTVRGTAAKTAGLAFLVLTSAVWAWFQVRIESPVVPGIIGLGVFGGLVVALVTIFKKDWAGWTSPLYALLEGLALGAISAMFEGKFHGIALQAVGLTFGTLFLMLAAYSTGVIRATEKFKLGVFAATGAIALLYIVNMVLGLFGIHSMKFIHEGGAFGIGFSLVVVGIAALNFIIDFDFIENAAAQGAPKYMEWYGAFGLLVTMVWLYLEILRLLSKLRSR